MTNLKLKLKTICQQETENKNSKYGLFTTESFKKLRSQYVLVTACAINFPAFSFVKLVLSFFCRRLGFVKLKGHLKSNKIPLTVNRRPSLKIAPLLRHWVAQNRDRKIN